jgi:hypothetical protein
MSHHTHREKPFFIAYEGTQKARLIYLAAALRTDLKKTAEIALDLLFLATKGVPPPEPHPRPRATPPSHAWRMQGHRTYTARRLACLAQCGPPKPCLLPENRASPFSKCENAQNAPG